MWLGAVAGIRRTCESDVVHDEEEALAAVGRGELRGRGVLWMSAIEGVVMNLSHLNRITFSQTTKTRTDLS